MTAIVLEPEEIYDITKRKHHKSQARVLDMMGITNKRRPDGTICVLRSHIESALGGATTSGKVRKQAEPNWSAIR